MTPAPLALNQTSSVTLLLIRALAVAPVPLNVNDTVPLAVALLQIVIAVPDVMPLTMVFVGMPGPVMSMPTTRLLVDARLVIALLPLVVVPVAVVLAPPKVMVGADE